LVGYFFEFNLPWVTTIMLELKKELYRQCVDYVEKRASAAQLAVHEATEAANDDTKSSAGDKYETGREMMQQDAVMNQAQLNEANKLKITLSKISTGTADEKAVVGSMVLTDKGNFYISISAGAIKANGMDFFAVSPASPIGLKLLGLKAGNEFNLNNKLYNVKIVM
jgi:transcription elongation GreA/GreB family factor